MKSKTPNISRRTGAFYFLVSALLVSASHLHAAPGQTVLDGLNQLQTENPEQVEISLGSATGAASFLRFKPGATDSRLARTESPNDKTRKFLSGYESVFGLANHSEELILKSQSIDAYHNGHARYRQVYKGLPVFGAELSTHFDRNGQLRSISSSTFDIQALDIIASWQPGAAERVAINHVVRTDKNGLQADSLHSTNTKLLVFRSGLIQGVPGNDHLAYQVEVVNETRSVREFIFVDAHTGGVLNQITGIHHALDRKVSEGSLPNIRWQDSTNDPDPITPAWDGGTAQQVSDWQDEIDGGREIYNLFASMTAATRFSYGGADETLLTINNDAGNDCPNAYWDGISTNYCSRVTSDDIVAHEWGHAYTEYTANLVYQWQSGALNESYSDIWGEVVDLLNGRGTDAPGGLRTDGSCSVYSGSSANADDSYRWLIAEDSQALRSGMGIRDMWNPNCYGDPGKVTDPKYYCFTGDSGGVHYNSAIPNHAFALMADGGSYNGRDIAGIGLTKAVHIFWNSLLMLTPVSGFADQADALEASCSSLTGINLPALSTNVTNAGASGEIISAGDCNEVQAVVDAVELRITPTQCGFDTVLETEPPVRCLDKGELQRISLTDWETGLGSWAVGRHDVANPATFSTADWAVVSVLPGERSGSAAFVADLIEGNCEDDDETGALTLDSPGIEIPGNVVTPRLSIDHWMASELKWDGGNLKISVNSGPFTLVPASAFDVGPYNSSLYVARNSDINTNPLAGEAAFTGTDEGTSDGSWGQSQLDLSGIAGAGDVIRLRFDFGQDGCNGVTGWYVDEVEFFSCSLEQLSLNCGNGVLDGDEQCDDGNKLVGDGCSGSCRVEPGWQCSEQAVTNALLSAPAAENSVQNTGAMSVLSDSAVSSEAISICIDTRPAVIFSDGFED